MLWETQREAKSVCLQPLTRQNHFDESLNPFNHVSEEVYLNLRCRPQTQQCFHIERILKLYVFT